MNTDLFEAVFALLFLVVGPLLEYVARRRRLRQMEAEDAEAPPTPTLPVTEPLLKPREGHLTISGHASRPPLTPHLERFVENLYAPFVEFFDTYEIELHGPLVAQLRPSVAKRIRSDPTRWASLAYDAGRAIYQLVPGLREQAQHATLYGEQAPEPELIDGLDEIFADMLATLWLGPAYATALLVQASQAARRPPTPGAAPVHLRFMASTKVLDEIGRHREATQLRTRWVQNFYNEYSMLQDDSLPSEVETLVENLLLYPFGALAEHTLLDIPGLAYSHATHSHVRHAVDAFTRDSAVRAAPREVVAAAIVALDRDASERERLLAWAERSILQRPDAGLVRSRAGATVRGIGLKASLRRTLADPDELAKVLAVGAFFPRPHDARRCILRGD